MCTYYRTVIAEYWMPISRLSLNKLLYLGKFKGIIFSHKIERGLYELTWNIIKYDVSRKSKVLVFTSFTMV